MHNFKRLLVFGCSYSSGEEILYHELGKDLEILRKNTTHDPRIWLDKIDSSGKGKQLEEIKKRQLEHAWPAKLAKLLDIECLNFSKGGNSLQNMLWEFLNFEHTYGINEDDIILFSRTKAERNVYFGEGYPMAFQIASASGPEMGRILGVTKSGNVTTVITPEADNAIIGWFNDDRITWDYINFLQSFALLRRTHFMFLVPSMKLSTVNLQSYNKDLFNSLILEHTDMLIGTRDIDSFTEGPYDKLLWGHPKEIVQERFAQHLYSTFI